MASKNNPQSNVIDVGIKDAFARISPDFQISHKTPGNTLASHPPIGYIVVYTHYADVGLMSPLSSLIRSAL